MEGLIIMVIAMIVSSLFGKAKNDQKKEPKQMPPFSSQPAPRKQEVKPKPVAERPKTLEDFANEVFGQLNEKTKPAVNPADSRLPKPVVQQVAEPVQREVKARTENTRSTRPETDRPIVAMAKKEAAETFRVVPSNQRELMQAVIMTEVLGPPKAKRK